MRISISFHFISSIEEGRYCRAGDPGGRLIHIRILFVLGDGELAFLCSRLQEAIGALQRVEELDGLAAGLVREEEEQGEEQASAAKERDLHELNTCVLRDEELAFGPTPAYSISKALLNALTRLQAAQGTNVIAVCPGDVETRMCSDLESSLLQTPRQAAQDVVSLALRCCCPFIAPSSHACDARARAHAVPWCESGNLPTPVVSLSSAPPYKCRSCSDRSLSGRFYRHGQPIPM